MSRELTSFAPFLLFFFFAHDSLRDCDVPEPVILDDEYIRKDGLGVQPDNSKSRICAFVAAIRLHVVLEGVVRPLYIYPPFDDQVIIAYTAFAFYSWTAAFDPPTLRPRPSSPKPPRSSPSDTLSRRRCARRRPCLKTGRGCWSLTGLTGRRRLGARILFGSRRPRGCTVSRTL